MIYFGQKKKLNFLFTAVLALWFFIPLTAATLGTIKDARYIYPALVPLFIWAAAALARIQARYLATGLAICMLILPGVQYMRSNQVIDFAWANRIVDPFDPHTNWNNSILSEVADPNDWRLPELSQFILQTIDSKKTGNQVLFLGGNRYYHINLLRYAGLSSVGQDVGYYPIPYTDDLALGVPKAMEFIREKNPSLIIYKTGENWPAFSSKLDSEIIKTLKSENNFEVVDTKITQPDGSEFFLLVRKAN